MATVVTWLHNVTWDGVTYRPNDVGTVADGDVTRLAAAGYIKVGEAPLPPVTFPDPLPQYVTHEELDLALGGGSTAVTQQQLESARLSAIAEAGTYTDEHVWDASDVTTGVLDLARIPSLDAARVPALDSTKIATGTLDLARIPTLDTARIPDLPASKIASGTLDALRIPTLDASKIGTGSLDAARVPTLDAAKIGTGTLAVARVPDLAASKIATGTLDVARVPDLDAAKIATGTLAEGRIPYVAPTQAEAEAGAGTSSRVWSPLRVWQSINANLLGSVPTQAIVEAGTDTTPRAFTVQRIAQLVSKLGLTPADPWQVIGVTAGAATYKSLNGGSWTWYTSDGSFARPQYRKFGRLVILRGLVGRIGAASGASDGMFQLPVGYRPGGGGAELFSTMQTNNTAGRVDVLSDGSVVCIPATPVGGFVSVSGIWFWTD